MKVAVTIAECPQGSGNWGVLREPSYDVQGHKDAIDDLVNKHGTGNDRVLVLTPYGVAKRKRIALPSAEPPKAKKTRAEKD